MSDSFISISRGRNQNVLVINTDLLKPKLRMRYRLTRILVAFFSVLDKASSFRLIWVAAAGIGLGIGLSVTVSQQPSGVGANLLQQKVSTPNDGLIVPQSLQLPFYDEVIPVEWDAQTGELGEDQIILAKVQDKEHIASLKEVSVGEVIKIMGTNQGIYSHRITEIHVLPNDQIMNVIQHESNAVVIIAPSNIFQTESLVIKARPN